MAFPGMPLSTLEALVLQVPYPAAFSETGRSTPTVGNPNEPPQRLLVGMSTGMALRGSPVVNPSRPVEVGRMLLFVTSGRGDASGKDDVATCVLFDVAQEGIEPDCFGIPSAPIT
mmetsp:Transcript_160542/g.295885  ORF Transcript_160542/g.295885 Transcript_160542/m.295885 type:complete len:115 (-) Transcript_160542:820-1164(-)